MSTDRGGARFVYPTTDDITAKRHDPFANYSRLKEMVYRERRSLSLVVETRDLLRA